VGAFVKRNQKRFVPAGRRPLSGAGTPGGLEPPKDSPRQNVKAVENLFTSLQTGEDPAGGDGTRFFILGLSPNIGRLAIRFWITSTIGEISGRVRQYFEDIRIVHGGWEKEILSLFRLLVSTAAQGKADNIPPNLTGETMRAILEGLPFPQTLLQAVIRRIRADQEVNYPRAALIKACLNRAARIASPGMKEELHMSLDPDNGNIGYRLGRLFATLEKIQKETSAHVNSTLRDRFYGAASGTPASVFGNFLRLNQYHLAKIQNTRRREKFERLLGQILEGVPDFPARLGLTDQGRFAVGYYHQKQDFFVTKDHPAEAAS
jgi:CRISPR-associated protein Csd1